MKGTGTAALLLAALGNAKKPSMMEDDEEAPESSEGGDGEAKMAAAEEVMAAIESKDATALAEALESFIECSGDYGPQMTEGPPLGAIRGAAFRLES